MDLNRDGVVTLDEFLDCCRNDDAISRSMAVFDSSFWHDASVADHRPSKNDFRNSNSINDHQHQNQKLKINFNGKKRNQTNPSYRQQNQQQYIRGNGHSTIHLNRFNSANSRHHFSDYYSLHHECEINNRLTVRPAWGNHEAIRPQHFSQNIFHRSNDMPLQAFSAPPSPSLVKVRAWYTVAKQGVC